MYFKKGFRFCNFFCDIFIIGWWSCSLINNFEVSKKLIEFCIIKLEYNIKFVVFNLIIKGGYF